MFFFIVFFCDIAFYDTFLYEYPYIDFFCFFILVMDCSLFKKIERESAPALVAGVTDRKSKILAPA